MRSVGADHRARNPELYADAAYAVITRPSREGSGNAFSCEDVLAAEGVTDFDQYAYQPRRQAAGRLVRRPRLSLSRPENGSGQSSGAGAAAEVHAAAGSSVAP